MRIKPFLTRWEGAGSETEMSINTPKPSYKTSHDSGRDNNTIVSTAIEPKAMRCMRSMRSLVDAVNAVPAFRFPTQRVNPVAFVTAFQRVNLRVNLHSADRLIV